MGTNILHADNMKCICCQSNHIVSQHIEWRKYHKCLVCGFIFISRKVDGNLRHTVFNHYQSIDPHERIAASKESFFRLTLNYLSSQINNDTRSILDVGCGFGYFLEFASRNGWSAFGVDIVDDAVQSARKRVGEENIFHGSLRDAHYPDTYFDAITAWDILMIVDDPLLELRECYRILKQGGIIGIRARNLVFQELIYRLYLPLRKIALRLGVRNPYVFHPYCFTSKSMYFLLHRIGFTRIKIVNSPLTKGDPYSYSGIAGVTTFLKTLVDLLTNVLFRMTAGRCILGPSLLIWAEKP